MSESDSEYLDRRAELKGTRFSLGDGGDEAQLEPPRTRIAKSARRMSRAVIVVPCAVRTCHYTGGPNTRQRLMHGATQSDSLERAVYGI
jgi:hypothetical protein